MDTNGAAWFTEMDANRIGRLAPGEPTQEFSIPTADSGPSHIAGINLPFGEMWFTESRANRIGRFVTPSSGPAVAVPAAGSTRVSAKDLPAAGWSAWVINSSSFFLPTVDARVFQRSRPEVSASLPATRLSTLRTVAPKVLSFPGARRTSGGARSNLFLTFLDRSFPVLVRFDALSPEGNLLGSLDLEIRQSVYLTDIVSRLTQSSLDDGQIRVTLIAGDALVWGYLATAQEDGSISVRVGANP